MVVSDRSFRLANVLLLARGRYAVRVYWRQRHRWKGTNWARLASDFFEVI
jgi:hypothetical protein